MALDNAMTATALLTAKTHVYNVCNQGTTITLIKPGTKDEFGYILNESTFTINSFPVRYSPYDRETTNKISWSENTDILCYVSKLAVENSSVTIEQLRHYKNLRVSGKRYEIIYVEPYSAFANDFLYVVIGGKA